MGSVFKRNKLPFMLGILYSVPLLMISILCASLALDKPQVAIWRTNVNYPGVTVIKKAAEQGFYIATQYTSTSNATEWRIWGWAIVPAAHPPRRRRARVLRALRRLPRHRSRRSRSRSA